MTLCLAAFPSFPQGKKMTLSPESKNCVLKFPQRSPTVYPRETDKWNLNQNIERK